MNIIQKALLLGSTGLAFFSCSDEAPWKGDNGGEGKIKIHVSSSSDLESEIPNVRSVSTDIVVPAVSDFQVRMTNSDGSYVKTWSSVTDFEKETNFKADTYTIEAFYGSPDSQGIVKPTDKGHEYTYFYGISENVKVEPGKETQVQIHTTLANSVVVIEYSDAFKNYFKEWSTQLITAGESPLDLGKDEGMCYVIPGEVDVVISATQQNGKSVKLNPAKFDAEARHLYKIMYNVFSGGVGHAETLQLIFNDDPESVHTISIDLTDELISGEGPVITTEGFESGDQLMTVAGSPYDGIVRFNIDSPDGITEAILTIKTKDLYVNFLDANGTIDLCQASYIQREQMTNAGVKVLGLFENPERLAMVDVTEFCRYLTEGDYEFTLVIKDKLRTQDATVKMTALPISVEAAPNGRAVLGRGYTEVKLAYNGTDPTNAGSNPFSFRVKNELGLQEASDIISVSKALETRSFEAQDYIFRISVPETMLDEYDVNVYINDADTPIDNTTVEIDFPEYDVEYDPMTKRVMMRVSDVKDNEVEVENVKEWFTKRLRVYVNNSEVATDNLSLNNGTLTAKGLAGGSSFKIHTSLEASESPETYSEEKTLNYEQAAPVPDSDFANVFETFSIDPINVGGEWTVSPKTYQTQSSIQLNIPTNSWATLNPLTCYTGNLDNNIPNTWGIVPSTYIDGNEVVVRTVGYSHNNISLNTTGGVLNRTYYNTNKPSESELNKQAGELFLGKYTYDGNAIRTDGINFTSRPSGFSFNYIYSPINNENGVMYIKMKDSGGTYFVNEERLLVSSTESQEISIDFPDYSFGDRIISLEISFKSSNSEVPGIVMPTDLNEGVTVGEMTSNVFSGKYLKHAANTYKAFAAGSVLRVSNLQFSYE